MPEGTLGRGTLRPIQRIGPQIVRVGSPMLGGALAGLCLALAGVRPTLLGMGVSGAVCGLMLGTGLVVARPRRTHSNRYLADWSLLFGTCLGAALLYGNRVFG